MDGGEAFRVYVYVYDAIECVVRALERPDVGGGEILQSARPRNEVTIRELAR